MNIEFKNSQLVSSEEVFRSVKSPSSSENIEIAQSLLNIQPTHTVELDDRLANNLSNDIAAIAMDFNSMQISKKEDPILPTSVEDLVASSPEAQKLLRFTSKQELESVLLAQKDENMMVDLANKIREGAWNEMLTTYGKTKGVDYVLLAAFCQKRISVEELSTALLFYAAYYNAKNVQDVKIVPVTAECYSMFQKPELNVGQTPQQMRAFTENILHSVPANQRFTILVKLSSFDTDPRKYESITINQTFVGPSKTLGTRKYRMDGDIFLGTASFGLMKAFLSKLAEITDSPVNKFVPTLHLTPTMKEMLDDLANGENDIALFLADEHPLVHGITNKSIFGFAHDWFHTEGRILQGAVYSNAIQAAQKLYPRLEVSRQLAPVSVPYASIPIFTAKPSFADGVGCVVENALSALVDGEFYVPTDKPASQSVVNSTKAREGYFTAQLSYFPIVPETIAKIFAVAYERIESALH